MKERKKIYSVHSCSFPRFIVESPRAYSEGVSTHKYAFTTFLFRKSEREIRNAVGKSGTKCSYGQPWRGNGKFSRGLGPVWNSEEGEGAVVSSGNLLFPPPLFSGPLLYLLFGHEPPRAHRARGGAGPICAFSGAPGDAAELSCPADCEEFSGEEGPTNSCGDAANGALFPSPHLDRGGWQRAPLPPLPLPKSLLCHTSPLPGF